MRSAHGCGKDGGDPAAVDEILQRIRDEMVNQLSHRYSGHLRNTLGGLAEGVGASRSGLGGGDERGAALVRASAETSGLDASRTSGDARRAKVPLAELRPRQVEMFDRAGVELSDAEQSAMRRAHANISRLLRNSDGAPLSRFDLRLAVKNVNATIGANPTGSMRSMRNCTEAALAVDEILGGRPAVAGPLPGAATSLARGVYRIRAIDHPLRRDRLDDAEQVIRENPGSRGIIIAHGGAGTDHVFNIADVNGRTTYLDGVFGTTLDKRPRYSSWFPEFDFYRTA